MSESKVEKKISNLLDENRINGTVGEKKTSKN